VTEVGKSRNSRSSPSTNAGYLRNSTLGKRLVLTRVLVQVPEGPTENLILYFPECNACIQQAINEGGKILVHCNAGLSRSAAVVVAYVRFAPRVCLLRAHTCMGLCVLLCPIFGTEPPTSLVHRAQSV
jgi:hypothetical protein